MPARSPLPPRHPIRVVLSSTALLPLVSLRTAAAPVLAQLGVAAFFVSSVSAAVVGPAAGWFVLGAGVLAALARAIDIESWALLVPGGFSGRVGRAYGTPLARGATAIVLVERILLGALACVVFGHYLAMVVVTALAGLHLTGYVRPEDLATLVAVATIGVLWFRIRIGRDLSRRTIARGTWIGCLFLVLAVFWCAVAATRVAPSSALLSAPLRLDLTGLRPVDTILTYLVGIALTLPAIGAGEVLPRAAVDFPPPRVNALRRTAWLTLLFALLITAGSTFLFTWLVPASEAALWSSAPLVGLVQQYAGPVWLRDMVAVAIAAAAALMLVPVAHASLTDAEQTLHRSSADGTLPIGFDALHTRFGTPSRAVDVAGIAIVLVMIASGGRVAWLAHAYAIPVAVMLVLTSTALMRLRQSRGPSSPFRTPFDISPWGRVVPVGLIVPAVVAAASVGAMIVLGDLPSIAVVALLGLLAVRLTLLRGRSDEGVSEEPETFDLLRTADLSLDHVEAAPGNVLVPVRNPHALLHLAKALEAAAGRDVVVITVRLLGVDTEPQSADERTPTRYERRLLADVVATAERYRRPVRLLIVPGRDVVETIVATVIRLRSSEVYVGESSTLSADDQARLLGDAWERAPKPDALAVRLVVCHSSGRSETYHLGAHPPALTPADLDLIHRVWLDAVKAVGPHIHHHDVVRAALTQMEQQLSGPERDEALAAIRNVAQPAEELTALLRNQAYAAVRDMLRNRHPGDIAALLTSLRLEDQVVVFRVLPRKDAATVFEYLSREVKQALLKAMAQEDVAAILNNMAPDDRTMFLEELPATATRELLSLLTPDERAVASTLLGYPEKSVGRLMTPDYVAVREPWAVREVLEYVRGHGQDSETLNHIYVVDDQGLLIDDIRIREFLLAPLERRVADLMDRRFVALKATDDQEAAVATFRQYDRTALPVTDTTGMLIGIVTIDDILDVAEATATREIQRIGGSEALDQPYMQIAFLRMIQKRAGWLTALFLGEMLTATAMGFFEEEIARAVVLALFVPLIISSGGNSGSQAATLVIRALALGEVTVRDWWRVMRREVLAGLTLGAILGSIGFLRITLWSAFSDIYGPHWLLVALTVAVALVGVVLWGTLTGSVLPFLLKRLGFDPAASSAPFVATLVDVTGLVIYFSVAVVVLRGTLL